MQFKNILGTICATVVAASFGPANLSAQPFSISWFSIDGGGGYSTGSNFELDGSIGQHDAGAVMTGGGFELTGGFWAGGVIQAPIQTAPDSFVVTKGTYVSGGLPELAESDNMDLSLRRLTGDTQSRTEFEVKGISPSAAPSSFEFTLEGAVFARGNVVQTIELFDYVAAAWELVDTRNAVRSPVPDSVVTVAATGDLSRFVEAGTMFIEARVRYKSDSPRQNFASNTDQTIWTIGQ